MPAAAATNSYYHDALHMVKDDFYVASTNCQAVRGG